MDCSQYVHVLAYTIFEMCRAWAGPYVNIIINLAAFAWLMHVFVCSFLTSELILKFRVCPQYSLFLLFILFNGGTSVKWKAYLMSYEKLMILDNEGCGRKVINHSKMG